MRAALLLLTFSAAVLGSHQRNRTACFQYLTCLEEVQGNFKHCAGGTGISLTLESKDVNIRDLVKYRALEFVGCQDRILKEIIDFEALQVLVNEDGHECFEKLPESTRRREEFSDSCDFVVPSVRNESHGDAYQCLLDYKQDREYCETLLECCPDHSRCGERMNAVSMAYQNARVKSQQIVSNMLSCVVSNDPRFTREGNRLQSLRDPYRNSGVPFLRPDKYTEDRITRRLALTSANALALRKTRFSNKYMEIRQLLAQKLIDQYTTTHKFSAVTESSVPTLIVETPTSGAETVDAVVEKPTSGDDAEAAEVIADVERKTEKKQLRAEPKEELQETEEVKKQESGEAKSEDVVKLELEAKAEEKIKDSDELSSDKRVEVVRNLIRTSSDKDLARYVALIAEGNFAKLFSLAAEKERVSASLDEVTAEKMKKIREVIKATIEKSSEASETPDDVKIVAARSLSEKKEDPKAEPKVDKKEKTPKESKDEDEKVAAKKSKKSKDPKDEKKSGDVTQPKKESNEKKEPKVAAKEPVEVQKEPKLEAEKPHVEQKKSHPVPTLFTIEEKAEETKAKGKNMMPQSRLAHMTINRSTKLAPEPVGDGKTHNVTKSSVTESDKPKVTKPAPESFEKGAEVDDKDRVMRVEAEIKAASDKVKLADRSEELPHIIIDDLPKLSAEASNEKKTEDVVEAKKSAQKATLNEDESKKLLGKLVDEMKEKLDAAKPVEATTVKSELVASVDELLSSKTSATIESEGSGEEPTSTTPATPTTAATDDVIFQVKQIRPRTEQNHCQVYASCWQTVNDYEQQCDRKYSTDVLSHGIDDTEILNILVNSSISHHEIVLKACLRPLDRSVHATLKQLLIIQRGVRKACLDLGRNKIAVTDTEEALCSAEQPTTQSVDEFLASEHVRTASNHLTCRAKLQPLQDACQKVRTCCASVDVCDNYIASSPVKKMESEAVSRLVKRQNDCETKMLQTLNYIHQQLSSPARRRRYYI